MLFSASREVASDQTKHLCAKHLCALHASEAPRYLLMNLGHPNIILTLVVA
tara:strand:+ start:1429 stop:1581 length:153 start_codon:yes stop_codon:yes gene_type:complete